MSKKNASLGIVALILSILCAACGPKEITTFEEEDTHSSISMAEQMRYPLYGQDRNQRMLYTNNLMNTMVFKQNYIQAKLAKSTLDKEAEKARLIPKERSPFLD